MCAYHACRQTFCKCTRYSQGSSSAVGEEAAHTMHYISMYNVHVVLAAITLYTVHVGKVLHKSLCLIASRFPKFLHVHKSYMYKVCSSPVHSGGCEHTCTLYIAIHALWNISRAFRMPSKLTDTDLCSALDCTPPASV